MATLGRTDAGASAKDANRYATSTQLTMPEAGQITSIVCHMSSTVAGGATCGIASDSSGTPNTLLADTDEQTISTKQDYTFTLDTPYNASNGEVLHVIVHGSDSTGISYYYDAQGSHVTHRTFAGYTAGTVTVPINNYLTNHDFTIYLVYTPTGGGSSGVPSGFGLLGVGF